MTQSTSGTFEPDAREGGRLRSPEANYQIRRDDVAVPPAICRALRLRGGETIEACIGEGWAFYVFGSEMDNQGEIQVADHPSCIRPFSLAAGEAIRWAKTVQVPRVSAGQGSLNGSIQLVDPRMCNGRHGCYAESISSEIVIVVIHE